MAEPKLFAEATPAVGLRPADERLQTRLDRYPTAVIHFFAHDGSAQMT